jgi:hypothetical protein
VAAVATADAALDALLAAFATDVAGALRTELLSLVVYGSAAGDDWVAGRSDVNTAIVVPQVGFAVLEALAPVVGRWRPRGFAVPLVVEREFLARARDTFPIELEDIRRQHRVLHGADLFAGITVDPGALRRECEQEARGKLLRLRAVFLGAADERALAALVGSSVKSFLTVLRHLLTLRGRPPGPRYADVLAAGEALLGPLPAMGSLLAHRRSAAPAARLARAELAAYLTEVERIVHAVDAGDA